LLLAVEGAPEPVATSRSKPDDHQPPGNRITEDTVGDDPLAIDAQRVFCFGRKGVIRKEIIGFKVPEPILPWKGKRSEGGARKGKRCCKVPRDQIHKNVVVWLRGASRTHHDHPNYT